MATTTGKPPYLTNPEDLSLQDLVDACEILRVDTTLMDFAMRQFKTLRDSPAEFLSIETIAANEGVNASTVRRRLKQLAIEGVFNEISEPMEVSPGVTRRALLFQIASPDSEKIRERREREEKAANRLAERRGSLVDQNDLTSSIGVQDNMSLYLNMMWSLIFPVLSYSRRDQSESRTVILNEIGFRFPVEATSQHGTPIARVVDLVAWTALLSLCLEDLRERKSSGKPISNKFTIKGATIAKALRISRTEYLSGMLQRLNNTQISLNEVPPSILDKWGYEEVSMNTSFIHELVMARMRHTDDQKENPGAWVFKWQLSHYVYEMLLSKMKGSKVNLTSLSQDLLDEKNNVISALHLYSRRVITHREKIYDISLDELHKKIAPSLARHDFFEMLGDGLNNLYKRELAYLESSDPLRHNYNGQDSDDDLKVSPHVPSAPEGLGKNSLSKHLPTEANVECFGFNVVINGGNVYISRNHSDPLVGMASETERKKLIHGAGKQQSLDLFDSPDSINIDF